MQLRSVIVLEIIFFFFLVFTIPSNDLLSRVTALASLRGTSVVSAGKQALGDQIRTFLTMKRYRESVTQSERNCFREFVIS